jgi:hypothetical protein
MSGPEVGERRSIKVQVIPPETWAENQHFDGFTSGSVSDVADNQHFDG